MKHGPALSAALMALAYPSVACAEGIDELAHRQMSGRVTWDWVGISPGGAVTVDLVRADVRIIRSDGDRVELHITSPDPDMNGSAITLTLSHDEKSLRLIDRYPPSKPSVWRECLPPDDEHGGPWLYDDKLDVVLIVPRRMHVTVSTMSGNVIGT